jgi:2,3-dihydroxyphenylpropionate 1,2-dioxygenase
MAAKNQFPLNSNHPLVNPDWDLDIMDAFARGDSERVRRLPFDEIQEKGGHGGQEVRTWAVVMGAMGGAPAGYSAYEAVQEFICGMGYVTYDT